MMSTKIKPRKEARKIEKGTISMEEFLENNKDERPEYDFEETPIATSERGRLICPHCGEEMSLDNVEYTELYNKFNCWCESCFGVSEIDVNDLYDPEIK